MRSSAESRLRRPPNTTVGTPPSTSTAGSELIDVQVRAVDSGPVGSALPPTTRVLRLELFVPLACIHATSRLPPTRAASGALLMPTPGPVESWVHRPPAAAVAAPEPTEDAITDVVSRGQPRALPDGRHSRP